MSKGPSRLTFLDSHGDRTLVLEGDLDCHTAPQLDAAIQDLGSEAAIVLDLARVEFVDSSGLRVIVTAHTALDEVGHKLTLLSPQPAVARLFEITGLTDHLHVA